MSNKADATATTKSAAITRTRIITHAPETPKAPERNLAGRYRVIHGSFSVGRDRSLTHHPDGSRKEVEPMQELAKPGAVLEFTHEDARDALIAGTIEELDAQPSRVGIVFDKDVAHDNSKASQARIAQHQSRLVRDIVAARERQDQA
jgi:hypothetical protein